MKRSKSEYAIQTVSNALRLLEAFHDDEELGVTALAERLRLHKNNVFRLLATLQHEGYVEQDAGSELYRLGVRCLELAHSMTRNRTLLREGRAALERLALGTRESAHLGVMREFGVVHLDGAFFPQIVQTALRIGDRLPVHCTALGKVLLAFADEGVRQAYDQAVVAAGRVEPRTPATIVDREKLFEHLRAVAAQGFALDLEECERGVACAAAPVFDSAGLAVAALSVSGPAFRLDAETLQRRIVPTLLEEADRLSRNLGHPQG